MSASRPTLASLARDLASGAVTSRQLVEQCLARIAAPAGEGARAFISVATESALAAADAMDRLRAAGMAPTPFAGIPIATKDLFDVRGEVTTAGSRVLADRGPATEDAVAVARLRAAGFIHIGRTNMTEFAYSGLGMNPHYGNPRTPWRRDEGRVSGGSTSGGAVAVADGMAFAALGTDTGGSCRIPAAFCGIVGYKPTASRVPQDGCTPLSPSLDSVGPLAASVDCCAVLDAVLAGEPARALKPAALAGLRLAVLRTVAMDGLDPDVAIAFAAALEAFAEAGATITEIEAPELAETAPMNSKGGFTAAESYAWHRELIARSADGYDPRVLGRISRGRDQSAADYIQLLAHRRSIAARANARFTDYDAVVFPTVAMLPPRIADLGETPADNGDAAYTAANLLALRNATLINVIDGCAVSLPIGAEDGPPVGLTIAGVSGNDRRILAIAAGMERLFRPA